MYERQIRHFEEIDPFFSNFKDLLESNIGAEGMKAFGEQSFCLKEIPKVISQFKITKFCDLQFQASTGVQNQPIDASSNDN